MALPIGLDEETVQAAAHDIVQSGSAASALMYEFEAQARLRGVRPTPAELPVSIHREHGVLTVGDESVRSDYDIATDEFVWMYKREEGDEAHNKIALFSSREVVPPSSRECYARFIGVARAMTQETPDG